MIKGHPCKVIDYSTSKTGKHGHAKAHIVALDIFTGKKYEDLSPTSHNMDCPFTKRTEYQLLTADADTGEVSLLLESGETKDDLNLPTFITTGEPTDEDKKVVEDILKMQEEGVDQIVGTKKAWTSSSPCSRPAERRRSSARRRLWVEVPPATARHGLRASQRRRQPPLRRGDFD